jgi:hypothetical protein
MTTPETTTQQRLDAEKIAIDAMTDTTEQALAYAVYRLKISAMNGDKGASSELTKASRELSAYCRARDDGDSGADEYFAKPSLALPYLQKGFIVNKSKFYKDISDGKVPRKNGVFKAADLLYYARAAGLKPTTTPDAADEPSIANYREDVQRENARKLRLQNDEREGSLIQRSLVEQELSARLAFLKRDLFNLGPRAIDTMMEKFSMLAKEQGVDMDSFNLLSLTSDLEEFWDKNMSAYLDSYARPRDFLPFKLDLETPGEE